VISKLCILRTSALTTIALVTIIISSEHTM